VHSVLYLAQHIRIDAPLPPLIGQGTLPLLRTLRRRRLRVRILRGATKWFQSVTAPQTLIPLPPVPLFLPEVGQNLKDRLCSVKPRSSRDIVYCLEFHRVHTEWQRPLSGVHSILIEKSALAGEGGGVHAHHCSLYLPSRAKLWCTLQLRGQIHSSSFYSTPISTLRSRLWHRINNIRTVKCRLASFPSGFRPIIVPALSIVKNCFTLVKKYL
jgi:hypothetical protein